MTASLAGGIIAAGEGRRLRAAGIPAPKPLVPVNGVPLIEGVIENFRAAGVTALTIILSEEGRACAAWVRARFPDLAVRFIVKTTASSLESFAEVAAARLGTPLLVSTVDAWCRPPDFVRFVEAAQRRPSTATVLAVTPAGADENPLWVDLDGGGGVTAIGAPSGALVTAGIYRFSARALAGSAPAGTDRLRDYLARLHHAGEPMYGEVIETVVDVDRREDVELAEALARGPVAGGGGV